MIGFQYARADDVARRGTRDRRNPAAKFIAGGTNLIDLMKMDVERPARLIDITRLPLKQVEETPDGGLRIGALVPNTDLAVTRWSSTLSACSRGDPGRRVAAAAQHGVDRRQPAAAHALPLLLRHRDALQQTRAGQRLLRDRGLNRMHAILGTSDACIATHPSDMCVALAALDATVACDRTSGRACNCVRGFPPAARRHAAARHQSAIQARSSPRSSCRPQGFAANYTYLKIRDRLSYAFALVSVAAALELDGDTIKEARFALGGVAHKPWRDPVAEAALRGQNARPCGVRRAADVLLRDAKGFEHNAFKIDLARRAIVRALTQAARGTPQCNPTRKSQ